MSGGWDATGDDSTGGSLAGEEPETGKQLEGMTERMMSLFTEGLGVEDGCDEVLTPSG